MILISRGSSNTAQKKLKVVINFVPDKKEYMESWVELGYPDETTEKKMKLSDF